MLDCERMSQVVEENYLGTSVSTNSPFVLSEHGLTNDGGGVVMSVVVQFELCSLTNHGIDHTFS